MKNSECEVQIISPKGWIQSYRKGGKKWIQNTNGVERECTSEQLLSHILPLLVENNKKNFFVRVIPIKEE